MASIVQIELWILLPAGVQQMITSQKHGGATDPLHGIYKQQGQFQPSFQMYKQAFEYQNFCLQSSEKLFIKEKSC